MRDDSFLLNGMTRQHPFLENTTTPLFGKHGNPLFGKHNNPPFHVFGEHGNLSLTWLWPRVGGSCLYLTKLTITFKITKFDFFKFRLLMSCCQQSKYFFSKHYFKSNLNLNRNFYYYTILHLYFGWHRKISGKNIKEMTTNKDMFVIWNVITSALWNKILIAFAERNPAQNK